MNAKHVKSDKPTNVFGEKVKERWRRDPWHVPKKKRLGFDLDDKYANALEPDEDE